MAHRPLSRNLSAYVVICTIGLFALTGCGGGPATESVAGKLSSKGQPVTGGTLMFAPVAEASVAATEPASAEVKSDGSFAVAKGLIAGKSRVTYYPPAKAPTEAKEWDGKGPRPEAAKGEYDNLKAEPAEVEIKSGKNDLTFELVPQ
jgi:hypothetical protein